MRRLLLDAIARTYLGKPDLAGFLATRLPDGRALRDAFRNELAFRLGWPSPVLHTLNVELTSRCNVACTYCDVNRELGRPARDLDPSVVPRLLAAAPRVRTLLPFQWGEPLLYPALDEVLAAAAARGVQSFLTTNGTLLDGDRFVRLARAGLTRLTVSLDGSPTTHAARRGYAQAAIVDRLAEASAARRRHRLSTALDVSMVVDGSVADELEAFRARLAPLCDRVQFIPRLKPGPRQAPCREPTRGLMVVLSDGTLTTCCADVRGRLRLGQLTAALVDPVAAYHSPAWRTLRDRHRRRRYPAPCADCSECRVPGVSPRFE